MMRHVQQLIDWCRIEPGFERAAVACEAVRRIVRVGDPEWRSLVAEFGEPTEADWALAQRTYGPTAGLPGLDS